jgi:hypothetical protein
MTKDKLVILETNKVIKVFTSPRDLVVKVTAQDPPAVIKAIPMVGVRGAIGPTGPTGIQGPTGPRGNPGAGAETLGLEGNNELEVTGIENETVVDSFVASEWRWIRYMVSISKVSDGENRFYATELTLLIDQENVNVSESGVIDNDGDMGTITVSEVGGNIQLVVTPNPSIRPITVRYVRIGLKS